MRICALMSTYNEADIAPETVKRLIQQGLDVWVIDNGSTDGTPEQLMPLLGHGLLQIETRRFYENDREVYDWTALLRAKVEVAQRLPHDWFLHVDADEIRESPWPEYTLAQAIERVDAEGFNLIQFAVYNFCAAPDGTPMPSNPGETCRSAEFSRSAEISRPDETSQPPLSWEAQLTQYLPPAYHDTIQVKAWKRCAAIDLTRWGGHRAERSEPRVYPVRFLLKHYPLRSAEQARRKIFTDRKPRFSQAERARGWHVQYDHYQQPSDCRVEIPRTAQCFDYQAACAERQAEAAWVLQTALEQQELPLVHSQLPEVVQHLTQHLTQRLAQGHGLEPAAALTVVEQVLRIHRALERGAAPQFPQPLAPELHSALLSLARIQYLEGNPRLFDALLSLEREPSDPSDRHDRHDPSGSSHPPVEFEVPVAWCQHPLVGEVHRTYVDQMRRAFAALGITVRERIAPHGQDFTPRPTEGCLFSYHSVGRQAGVWRVKEGYLPYQFTMDRQGYSGWLHTVHTPEFREACEHMDGSQALERVRAVRTQVRALGLSKYPQAPDVLPLVLPDGYLFLPLQMPQDTVIRLSAIDYLTAVRTLIAQCAALGLPLVIKRHPLCQDPQIDACLAEAGQRPGITVLLRGHLHSLLDGARAVVCCNSGVGFEALIQGKPVLSFGASDYASATYFLPTVEHLADACFALQQGQRLGPDDAAVARFLCAYWDHCCMDVRDLDSVVRQVRRAVAAAQRLEDFSPATA